MKFGLSTHFLAQNTLTAELVRDIRRAGINRIEVYSLPPHFEYSNHQYLRDIALTFRKEGLTINSIHAPFYRTSEEAKRGLWLSISAKDQEWRKLSLQEIKISTNLITLVPVSFLVVHYGAPGMEHDTESTLISLMDLEKFCRKRELTLVVENLPTEHGTVQQIVDFITDHSLDRIKLCLDIGHAHIEGEGIEDIFIGKDLLITTHIHDTDGKTDSHDQPFDGSIKWKKAMTAFREIKYKGPFMLESKDWDQPERILDEWKKVTGKLEKQYKSA